MMTTALPLDLRKLALRLKDVEQQMRDLGGAPQLSSSTIGDDDTATPLVLADVVADAAITNSAVPAIQESIGDQDAGAVVLLQTLNEMDADSASRFELSDQQLVDAVEQLANADQQIRDAFGQSIDQISGDVQTAIVSAGAATESAQHASDLATQAAQAATDATTAAGNASDAALAAANLAGTKGELIFQKTAPTGSRATSSNLWIDITPDGNGNPKNTPNRYDDSSSSWVPITDQKTIDAAAAASAAAGVASTAQSAATDAATKAQAAAAAASAAQDTATARPQILFSTNGPSGSAPTGSTWFQVNSAQSVVGQWQQTGTPASPVWTARAFTSDVIANVDIGKLTAGSAAIADLVAQRIAASTANIQRVNVANLFVTNGAVMDQATIDYLFAKVVQAYKITASMIDVNSLNGVTITGATLRSRDTGQRVELAGVAVSFYDDYNNYAGSIRGIGGNDQLNRFLYFQTGARADGTSSAMQLSTPLSVPVNGGSTPYAMQVTTGIRTPSAILQTLYLERVEGAAYRAVRVLGYDSNGVSASFDSLQTTNALIQSLKFGDATTQTTAYTGAGGTLLGKSMKFDDGTTQTTAYPGAGGTLRGKTLTFDDGTSQTTAYTPTATPFLTVGPNSSPAVNGTTDITSTFNGTVQTGGGIATSAWRTSSGFTVPAGMAGMWLLSLSIRSVQGGQAFLTKNGTAAANRFAFQDGTNATLNIPVVLAVGDVIRLWAYSTAASNSDSAATQFTAVKL